MTEAAVDYWGRAKETWKAARLLLDISPDSAAGRAYYAAFYAVSAWFLLEDKIFHKHFAVEAAVHRDLVKAGIVPVAFGEDFSALVRSRNIGDYGGVQHVSKEEAAEAIDRAAAILRTVAALRPDTFEDSPST